MTLQLSETKIKPEGPGFVPERCQLLLLLRNHVLKLLGVRCGNKVEVGGNMKNHIEAAHRLGRSRPRWSLQGGRRLAGSSAPSSRPGSCETPPRLPPEPGKSDMRHICSIMAISLRKKMKRKMNIGLNL